MTGFELRRELLREFYLLCEITLDTVDFVPPKINEQIQKDNFKLFKKTVRVMWRKHKREKGFFSVSCLNNPAEH
jgi:hypothetical protein